MELQHPLNHNANEFVANWDNVNIKSCNCMQIVAYIWMYVCAYSLFIGLNVVSTKYDK